MTVLKNVNEDASENSPKTVENEACNGSVVTYGISELDCFNLSPESKEIIEKARDDLLKAAEDILFSI